MKEKQLKGHQFVSIKLITILLGIFSVISLYYGYCLLGDKHGAVTNDIFLVKLNLKKLLNQLEVQSSAIKYNDVKELNMQPLVKLMNDASLMEGAVAMFVHIYISCS